GSFFMGPALGKRTASRASFEIFKGNVPDGMDVCHNCDNRICVNPDHLFIGTRKENMQDCKIKGRLPDGWKIRRKLNKEQVFGIIKDLNNGVFQRIIAEKY